MLSKAITRATSSAAKSVTGRVAGTRNVVRAISRLNLQKPEECVISEPKDMPHLLNCNQGERYMEKSLKY